MPDTKTAVGFRISSIEQAKYISKIADGVIIGSKLVTKLKDGNIDKFKSLAEDFSNAIHGDKI